MNCGYVILFEEVLFLIIVGKVFINKIPFKSREQEK
jgi:hypothetical protein